MLQKNREGARRRLKYLMLAGALILIGKENMINMELRGLLRKKREVDTYSNRVHPKTIDLILDYSDDADLNKKSFSTILAEVAQGEILYLTYEKTIFEL